MARAAARCTSATANSINSTDCCEGLTSGTNWRSSFAARILSSRLTRFSPPPCSYSDRQQRALRDYGCKRRMLSHLQRSGRKLIDDRGQPCRREITKCNFNVRLPRKVQPRKASIEQRRNRCSLRNRQRRFVQPCRLALGGGNNHAGISSGDHGLGEFGFEQVRLSRKRAVDDRIDLEFGRIRYHRHHIIDRDLSAAVREQHELFQLIARSLAVAAEQRHQARASVCCNTQIRCPQFVVNKLCEVALAVGIAPDRNRGLGALANLSQR